MTYNYEHGTLLSFKDALKHLGIEYFLDIGANIGCYSVFMSDLASLGKKFFSFEPNPSAFLELTKNISLQDNKELFELFQVASSDSNGNAIFQIVGELAGNNRIVFDKNSKNTIDVQCAPIDSLLNLNDSLVAIKIDVEGNEVRTLEGMQGLLTYNSCFV